MYNFYCKIQFKPFISILLNRYKNTENHWHDADLFILDNAFLYKSILKIMKKKKKIILFITKYFKNYSVQQQLNEN